MFKMVLPKLVCKPFQKEKKHIKWLVAKQKYVFNKNMLLDYEALVSVYMKISLVKKMGHKCLS